MIKLGTDSDGRIARARKHVCKLRAGNHSNAVKLIIEFGPRRELQGERGHWGHAMDTQVRICAETRFEHLTKNDFGAAELMPRSVECARPAP